MLFRVFSFANASDMKLSGFVKKILWDPGKVDGKFYTEQ